MKRTILIVSILFIAGSLRVLAQNAQENSALRTKIDNYLSEGVANGFSGSVLVARKGEIIINKGYGFANKENNILNSSHTVSTIGSVTKQFTATAILKLVEFKKLKVTDPLRTFFKDLPKDKKEITIHQLLTHSSGLIDVIGNGDFDQIPTGVFFNQLFDTKLIHESGSKYAYSNAGYSILARIIELVSGQGYEGFLNEHLFKPAGMTKTGYFKPQWDKKLIATGYARNVMNMGSVIDRFQKQGKVSWILKGNGGINSTTEDMFKWYKALKTNKILSKSLLSTLTTPYILEYEGKSSYYAYGWAIYNSIRNTKIISHNGGNRIFFHDFLWLPEEDVVIIFFTNASSSEVEVAWPIEKMIFDKNYTPEPIKKNSFFAVVDFTTHNEANRAVDLLTLLKTMHASDIENSEFLNQIGYVLLEDDKKLDWAIALFKINTELFPNEANPWDSLGDAYKKDGDKAMAIDSYQQAYKLDPTITASINSLAALGVKVELQKELAVEVSILNSYIGEYQLKPGMVISITVENGSLIVEVTGRGTMSAVAKSNIKFFLKEANTNIQFNKNKTGKVDSLSLFAGGDEMLAKRI